VLLQVRQERLKLVRIPFIVLVADRDPACSVWNGEQDPFEVEIEPEPVPMPKDPESGIVTGALGNERFTSWAPPSVEMRQRKSLYV
jgi:hypothetical protein